MNLSQASWAGGRVRKGILTGVLGYVAHVVDLDQILELDLVEHVPKSMVIGQLGGLDSVRRHILKWEHRRDNLRC